MPTYKKLCCRVIFPQDFTVEVPDDLDATAKGIFIKDYAKYLMETSMPEPEIESCDDTLVIEECFVKHGV